MSFDYYETIVILKPEGYEDSVNRIQSMCQDFTGKELKVDKEELGVRNLAYPIKETYTTGYYVKYIWKGTAENVRELERCMRIDDTVLKFITVKTEEEGVDLAPYEQEDEPVPAKEKEKQIVDLLDIIYNL